MLIQGMGGKGYREGAEKCGLTEVHGENAVTQRGTEVAQRCTEGMQKIQLHRGHGDLAEIHGEMQNAVTPGYRSTRRKLFRGNIHFHPHPQTELSIQANLHPVLAQQLTAHLILLQHV